MYYSAFTACADTTVHRIKETWEQGQSFHCLHCPPSMWVCVCKSTFPSLECFAGSHVCLQSKQSIDAQFIHNNTVVLLPDSTNVDTIAPWKPSSSLVVKSLLFLLFIHSVRVLYRSPVNQPITAKQHAGHGARICIDIEFGLVCYPVSQFTHSEKLTLL